MDKIKSVPERLAIFYERLGNAPPASNAVEALTQIRTIMNEVEDEFCGVDKIPNPPLTYMGRLYPPMDDFITKMDDGGLIAMSRRHLIVIEAKGGIVIAREDSGKVEFSKAGKTV